jgi:outer membrane receptor protein involved in Fe transport
MTHQSRGLDQRCAMAMTSQLTTGQLRSALHSLRMFASFAVVFVFSSLCVQAQTELTSITGTVRDSTGAAVAGGQVQARNIGTTATRSTATSAEGNFSLPLMPVGRYEVVVSAPGFQTTRSTIEASLTGATANFQLRVGGTSSEVTVAASSVQVQLQTESHDVSTVVSSTQLSTLPNSGRNLLNTATLGPASQPATDNSSSPGDIGFFNQQSNAVYIAGLDNYHTIYLQDGVENINLLDQTANILASVEAAQEVSTIVNNAPARFAEPAVVNVITKSGTNRLHGTAYDFLQNDAFNARNWFASSVPRERYNLFGGNLGGPILKNHLFGFFDYSGLRQHGASVFSGRVPTSAERQGDFTGEDTINDPATVDPVTGTTSPFPSNIIPASRFNRFATLWLQNYPSPNTPLTASNVNYIANLPTINTYDEYLGRVDWNISSNHQLFASFARNNGLITNSTITPNLFGIQYTDKGINASVAETATIGNNIVNVAKFGYNRSIVNRTQQGAGDKNYAQYYGLNGLNASPVQWASPYVGITGVGGLGDPYSPQGATQNRFQYADEIDWRIGNHSISIGGQFVQTMFDAYWVVNNNGNYSFSGSATAQYAGGAIVNNGLGLADLLLGYPTNATAAVGVSADPFRGSSVAGYVEDDWKLRPDFTLNIGLRYDFAQAPYDKNGHSALYSVALRKIVPGTYKSNFGDWGPRIGFSWGFAPNTLLRGGYGIYYAGNEWENLQFQLLYPPNVVQKSYAFSIQNQLIIENAISGSGTDSALPSPFTMDNPFKDPSVQEWNLNIQRSVGANTLFTVGYLGNVSRHVEGRADLNQAYAVSPGNTSGILDVKPDPTIGFAYAEQTRGVANFNALATSVARQFVNGLQFLASYTWSKSMDMWDGDNGAMQTIYNPSLNYHPAGWDRTHNFIFSGTYALPFGPGRRFANTKNVFNRLAFEGWQISGVYHLASGEPITISAVNNADRSPYVSVFANTQCNPDAGFQRTRFLIFNASCFVQPANGQYGSAGRNSVRQPRFNNADISLSKAFRFTEQHQLEFRAEAFDAFNHPNFLASGGTVGTPGLGRVISSTTQRIAQFGLRYSF